MSNRNLVGIVGLGAVLAGACASLDAKPSANTDPPDGGGLDTGQSPTTADVAENGSDVAVSDVIATGDSQRDGGSCGENVGPTSTWDAPFETSPWKLIAAADAADAGVGVDAAARGRDAGADQSGCSLGGPGTGGSVACRGAARTESSASSVTLAFEDGSRLLWDSAAAVPVPPELTVRDTVWVSYSHDESIVCHFCGSYWNDELQVRDREGGQILWISREGHRLDEPSDSLLRELFGVGAEQRQTGCRWSFSTGCYQAERVAYDHVLLTPEPQVVPYGTVTRVGTATGEFDVLWTYTEDTQGAREGCVDGPGIASATGFAVSRIPSG